MAHARSILKTRYKIIILAIIVVLTVSVALEVTKHLSGEKPEQVFLEKTGKISSFHLSCTSFPIFTPGVPDPSRVDLTTIDFEDGGVLTFVDHIGNIEVGRTYHIVYHEPSFCKQWEEKFYVMDTMEEIPP